MSIEISNKTQTTEINRQINSPTQKSTAIAGAETTQKTDSVNLSIEKAFNSLESLPSVNAERVAQLKSEIENGTYQIDNEKLAENIIKFEQALPNTG